MKPWKVRRRNSNAFLERKYQQRNDDTYICMPTHALQLTRVQRSLLGLFLSSRNVRHTRNGNFRKQKKNCRRHPRKKKSAARRRRNWRWMVPLFLVTADSSPEPSWFFENKSARLRISFTLSSRFERLSRDGKSSRKATSSVTFRQSRLRLSSLFITDNNWGIFLSSGEARLRQTQFS